MFHQVEFLPIAYFTVLMWVVSANIVAKLFGPMLIRLSSGWLQSILSKKVNVSLTSDAIVLHLFEERLLSSLNSQVLLTLMRDLTRLFGTSLKIPVLTEAFALQKIQTPENYWSGCPPNLR